MADYSRFWLGVLLRSALQGDRTAFRQAWLALRRWGEAHQILRAYSLGSSETDGTEGHRPSSPHSPKSVRMEQSAH